MKNFIRRAACVDANALLKANDDYTLGFFEWLTARHSYGHPKILDGSK